MNLLPQPTGIRPRLACEISPQGVVAARSDDAGAPLAAATRVLLESGAVVPSLKPGNIADRLAAVAAVRKALEDVGQKAGARGADVAVIVPDAAVRVLLLDFDALPNKLSEAMPIVRFRLKKLLPFDADDAMLSYQVMSTSKQMVRVLAVAIPRDVLAEYEGVVREAGFEPGSVLPSTLACLAGLHDEDAAALVVNATEAGVTTAIVRGGILLLHRSVDLQPFAAGVPANVPPAMFEGTHALPLVDVEESAGEWAAQEALPEHGRNPYADRASDEAAVQDVDGMTRLPVPMTLPARFARPLGQSMEAAPIAESPYEGTTVMADLNAEVHNAILVAPTTMREFPSETPDAAETAVAEPGEFLREAVNTSTEEEIAEAVNVAAAYFEDTLAQTPTRLLAAGPLGAEGLQAILTQAGVAATDGLRVRDMVTPDALLTSAVPAMPRGWLAGVAGALRG